VNSVPAFGVELLKMEPSNDFFFLGSVLLRFELIENINYVVCQLSKDFYHVLPLLQSCVVQLVTKLFSYESNKFIHLQKSILVKVVFVEGFSQFKIKVAGAVVRTYKIADKFNPVYGPAAVRVDLGHFRLNAHHFRLFVINEPQKVLQLTYV